MPLSGKALVLHLLLWLYFPFLAVLWLGIGFLEGFLLVKMWFIFIPVMFFMILLAIPFVQIPWACRCLFWRLPEDPQELRLPRGEMRGLLDFVDEVAGERELPAPDRVRLHAESVAHVYVNGKGERVLVLGGLALRCLSREALAGVVAHELGHFEAGDTEFSRRCHRRRLLMQVLESQLVFVIRQTRPVNLGFVMVEMHLLFWFFMNLLNPVPWLVVAYHRVFELIHMSHSRQQEFSADRFAVEQSGKEAVASILILMSVIEHLPWASISTIAEWHLATNTPIDRIFSEQAARAGRIEPREWERACRKALAVRTGWYDSHPCLKERLAAIGVSSKKALEIQPDRAGPPATALIDNWKALESRMTGRVMAYFHERHQREQDMEQIEEHLEKTARSGRRSQRP
jgi:Zn-dependent protease with chaperone function